MLISAIPADEFRLDHWWYGSGKGSVRALTHIPTGLSVRREGDTNKPVHAIHKELYSELELLLITHGVISIESN